MIILGSVPLYFSGCYTISCKNKLHRIADVAINLSGKDVGRKCIFQCGEPRATRKTLFLRIFRRFSFRAKAHGVEVCEWTFNPLPVSSSPRETGKWYSSARKVNRAEKWKTRRKFYSFCEMFYWEVFIDIKFNQSSTWKLSIDVKI